MFVVFAFEVTVDDATENTYYNSFYTFRQVQLKANLSRLLIDLKQQ